MTPEHTQLPAHLPFHHAERFATEDALQPRYHHIKSRMDYWTGKIDNHILCTLLQHDSGHVIALLSERPPPPDILQDSKAAPKGELVLLPPSIWAQLQDEAQLLFTSTLAQGQAGGQLTLRPEDATTLHATEELDQVSPRPRPPEDSPPHPQPTERNQEETP